MMVSHNIFMLKVQVDFTQKKKKGEKERKSSREEEIPSKRLAE